MWRQKSPRTSRRWEAVWSLQGRVQCLGLLSHLGSLQLLVVEDTRRPRTTL